MVQFGTRPAAVVGLLPQPLGANLDAAAAGLAAARPVGPLAEFTVGGTGDDARLLDVACREGRGEEPPVSSQSGQRRTFFFKKRRKQKKGLKSIQQPLHSAVNVERAALLFGFLRAVS